MDFWTRLIGGSGAQKRRSTANDPHQRVARFKRVYNQIVHIWQKSEQLACNLSAIELLQCYVQRLTTILNEESRSPAPHLCLTFTASSHVFTTISNVAAASHNEPLVRETVAFFSALVDSEEEDLLANSRFAAALMAFVSSIASEQSLFVGEDTDAEIVELLFAITAKIRLVPELLPVWFSSRATIDPDRGVSPRTDLPGSIHKREFPLCYQLIDHVHHEGRIGDFARTGLLYIFETSSTSRDLEQWIVESDLATLMASGLGALYSQLSRKLSVVHPKDNLPVVLLLSDYPEVAELMSDTESAFSEDFRVHMDTFLSYLVFWQDVLEHCRSPDVRQTLIDHFQVLFLQQLLYPSLFESSDVDGGSAVAVLNYLRRILDVLDHPELVHMILRYLLALPDEQAGRPRSKSVKKRRSTLMLLSKPSDETPELNPSLFNLVDLLLNCTRSRNNQTVASALKLITTILSKNHKYATGTLVNVTDVHIKDPLRTVGALHAEIDAYLALAESLVPGADLDKEYASFLKDVLSVLEAHPCSMKYLSLFGLNMVNQNAAECVRANLHKDVAVHHLTTGDVLFKSMMDIMSNFFTNNVETNLNLTEALVNLASCPNLRLEGWLCVEPADYDFDSNDTCDDEEDDLRDVFRARRRPKWTSSGAPVLMDTLYKLQQQIAYLRQQIPDLNEHVANRKKTFRIQEELDQALRLMANFPPPAPLRPSRSLHDEMRSSPGSWTPQLQGVLQRAISPLRSPSPRGRTQASQTNTHLSPAPAVPRRVTHSLSPSAYTLPGSPVTRTSSRGSSPAKQSLVTPSPQRPGVTSTLLYDIDDVANAAVLKQTIRFPLKPASGPRNASNTDLLQPSQELSSTETAEENTGGNTDGGEAVPAVNADASHPKEPCETHSTTGDGETAQRPAVDEKRKDVATPEEDIREASLSHVLTNIIILQQFVLEVIAMLQVRASLFKEVRFA